MRNTFLQLDSSGIQNSLNSTVSSLIEQVTPELPHTSFVTDLAFIMIIGAVITLAFFKIKQPLIIGYLFAGMLIGPLSPLWSWILPKGDLSADVLDGVGILSDISALESFCRNRRHTASICNWYRISICKNQKHWTCSCWSWKPGIVFNIGGVVLHCYCSGSGIHGCFVYFSCIVYIKYCDNCQTFGGDGKNQKRILHTDFGHTDSRGRNCRYSDFLVTVYCSGWNRVHRVCSCNSHWLQLV